MFTRRILLPGLLSVLALAGCSTSESGPAHNEADHAKTNADAKGKEVATHVPRAVFAYDGGLFSIDTVTGKVVDTQEIPGFLRVSNGGDGRHVLVTDGDQFRTYDTGLITREHGDHNHYYAAKPAMTAATFPAPRAGHVVTHSGYTTLFADGTGDITTFPSNRLPKVPDSDITRNKTTTPHHGVALRLHDGSLITTQGTADARNTVQVLSPKGEVLASTDKCPGVHGETTAKPTAAGDVVAFGCEDGAVIYRDGAFHKVPAPQAYGRSGTLVGSANSNVVLADHKVEKGAKAERPKQVTLIDTVKDSMRIVKLEGSYWFRSLARGPQGEALVLTNDGKLNVIDPNSGEVSAQIPVIKPWEEKDSWQKPGPIVKSDSKFAYVTDAEQKKLHVVDIATQKVSNTVDLPHTPHEMAVVTGKAASPAGH